MKHDELISRIIAGETGHAIDVQIARLAIPGEVHTPSYTTSIDAAVALIESSYDWEINKVGFAFIHSIEFGGAMGFIEKNPAAAIVLAWLRATKESYSNVAGYNLLWR